jgi:hypothetical protein
MSPTPSTPYIDTSKQNRRDLGQFVSQCFDALNTYGKTPDQLANATKMFVNILKDYPMDAVIKAFGSWMRRSSIMPTPADIINIIDPPPAKPCWNTVRAIENKIKENLFVMDEERNYLTYCSRYTLQEFQQNQQDRKNLQQYQQERTDLLTNNHESYDYDHSI